MAQILVVDDDPGVRSLIEQCMIRFGHDVDTAVDGFDAVEKMASAAYDLVMTDVVMPEMDGVKLIAHIRETYPALRVVAISGGGGDMSLAPVWLERARKAGASRVLLKPFHAEDLCELTDELLG